MVETSEEKIQRIFAEICENLGEGEQRELYRRLRDWINHTQPTIFIGGVEYA